MAAVAVSALRISVDGEIADVTLDVRAGETNHLRALYREIGCDLVDVVPLTDGLDMWLDDEGMYRQPINSYSTGLAASFGLTHQPYWGTAVIVGGVDADGDLTSISPETRRVVLDIVLADGAEFRIGGAA